MLDNFSGESGSTQYFVMAHKLNISKEQSDNIITDSQHNELLWLSEQELMDRDDVHTLKTILSIILTI